jgi:hypothetical protein
LNRLLARVDGRRVSRRAHCPAVADRPAPHSAIHLRSALTKANEQGGRMLAAVARKRTANQHGTVQGDRARRQDQPPSQPCCRLAGIRSGRRETCPYWAFESRYSDLADQHALIDAKQSVLNPIVFGREALVGCVVSGAIIRYGWGFFRPEGVHQEAHVDRPGIFGGPCLPDVIKLPCLPGACSSYLHILLAACTRMRSAGARCCTSQPIPGWRA